MGPGLASNSPDTGMPGCVMVNSPEVCDMLARGVEEVELRDGWEYQLGLSTTLILDCTEDRMTSSTENFRSYA